MACSGSVRLGSWSDALSIVILAVRLAGTGVEDLVQRVGFLRVAGTAVPIVAQVPYPPDGVGQPVPLSLHLRERLQLVAQPHDLRRPAVPMDRLDRLDATVMEDHRSRPIGEPAQNGGAVGERRPLGDDAGAGDAGDIRSPVESERSGRVLVE